MANLKPTRVNTPWYGMPFLFVPFIIMFVLGSLNDFCIWIASILQQRAQDKVCEKYGHIRSDWHTMLCINCDKYPFIGDVPGMRWGKEYIPNE